MLEKIAPWIRRLTLFFVFMLLLISPFLQIIRTMRQEPYPYYNSPIIDSDFLKNILLSIDHQVRDHVDFFYRSISGGPFSAKLGPVTFAEPLSISVNALQNIFAISSWNMTMVAGLTIALGLALIFGRVFCGYVCPMSVITSTNQRLQQKFFGRFVRFSGSFDRRFGSKMRFFYLIILLVITATNPMIIQYILPPALFQNAISDFILYGSWTLWLTLIVILFAYELLKPGHFCRELCPTGTFLSMVSKRKMVHLSHAKGVDCTKDCKNCLDVCWLGLNPKVTSKIKNSACDLCTRCVEKCPPHRIKLLSLFLPILFVTWPQPLVAGPWDDKSDYHVDISEMTFFEGEISQNTGGDQLNFFYAVIGKNIVSKEDGRLRLVLHVEKKKAGVKAKKHKNIFTGPVTIEQILESKVIASQDFKTVSHPISIGNRSLYVFEFEFERSLNYKFIIRSQNGIFKEVELDFVYPPRRF